MESTDLTVLAEARLSARHDNVEYAVNQYKIILHKCIMSGVFEVIGSPKTIPYLAEQALFCANAWDVLPIEAAGLLAEDLVNYDSDFETSIKVLKYKNRLQVVWKSESTPVNELFISEDWTRNVGHIASIQYLIKLKNLGHAKWGKINVVARMECIANIALLQRFEPHINIITSPDKIRDLAPFVCGAGLRYYDIIEWNKQESILLSEAMNVIEALWKSENNAPLLSLDQQFIESARDRAEQIGLPRNQNFICVHVRGNGYHSDPYNPQRIADISEYYKLFDYIREQGDWVIRLGDPTMPPLPKMNRVIDYAHSKDRHPELDLFLMATCRFYIGTTSGLMHVPHCFGKKTLITNYTFVFGPPPLGAESLFLPKIVLLNGNKLTFSQMMENKNMRLTYNNFKFIEAAGSYINNSCNEIVEAAKELYLGSPLNNNQKKFMRKIPSKIRKSTPNIGKALINNHSELLNGETLLLKKAARIFDGLSNRFKSLLMIIIAKVN